MRKEDIDIIMNWCYKNNVIEFKNASIGLCITDGGWVNVIKLKQFLDGMLFPPVDNKKTRELIAYMESFVEKFKNRQLHLIDVSNHLSNLREFKLSISL